MVRLPAIRTSAAGALGLFLCGFPATSVAQDRPVVLRNATVLTAVGPPIERGTVVFAKGRIVAVGRDVAIPAGAEIVDLSGRYVMPGIVDPHSHLGVGGWPQSSATNDVAETSDPITPHARVADAYNTDDPAIRRVVAAGVTTVQVFPGSSNIVGGEGAVTKLKPGRPYAEVAFPGAPRLMKMAVGENPKGVYGRQNRSPVTRMGTMALLREAFTRAKEYRERWDAWEAKPAADRGPAPPRDLRIEPLADVLRGNVRVHIHCYRRDEFLGLLRLSDEFGFKIASFQHAMESYKVADELARRGVGVSVYPDAFGRKIEHWDQIPQNAAFLNASGVLVSLHSDFPFFAQRLNVEAAKLIRYGGISEADALKTITINPAKVIGVEKEIGSLEVGKQADIAVFDRDPLDSFARCDRTYIDGELVFDRKRESGRGGGGAMNARWPGFAIAAALAAAPASGQSPEPSPRSLVIQNVRILPVSGPPIEHGTIVVTGQRLAAVAAQASVPAGAEIVDGTGLTASPGFIDLGTGIGLVEIAQVPAANDGEESSDPVTPQVRAADAYFLDSELIPVVRAAGTTVILSTPGASNVIAGQSALMRTAGESLEEAALTERAALHVNLGEAPKRVWSGRGRAPMTRMGIAMLLRQTFQQAREYAAKRKSDPRSPVDLKLEPVAEALAGQLPVVAHAERREDIILALDLAREYGLRLILSGGSDAALVPARLAQEKVPVIIAIDQQPDGIETAGARYDTAARLHAAGVTVAFQSNEVTLSRNLVPNVGLAVAYGLPAAEALKALTLTPAQIFGVADRVGSLEAGKEATFILTRGDPLQTRSRIVATFVRGRRYAPRSYQTRLCETYIASKRGGIPCLSE